MAAELKHLAKRLESEGYKEASRVVMGVRQGLIWSKLLPARLGLQDKSQFGKALDRTMYRSIIGSDETGNKYAQRIDNGLWERWPEGAAHIARVSRTTPIQPHEIAPSVMPNSNQSEDLVK
jgi:hypothetical protein